MLIRPARRNEVVALSALAIETYSAAFGHTFSAADLAAHIAKHLTPNCFLRILDEDVVLVGDIEGRLVGYVQFGANTVGPSAGSREMELRRLYVHSDLQNQRVGGLLMSSALDHPNLKDAERVCLDVWEHNRGAQRFYRRYGFEVVGTRAFQVASGAETSLDLIMVRPMAGVHAREL